MKINNLNSANKKQTHELPTQNYSNTWKLGLFIYNIRMGKTFLRMTQNLEV